jgi:ABC-type nickel/cobalt efflux system permease component RcnA
MVADKTNMWEPQIFGLDSTIFSVLIVAIVVIIAIIVVLLLKRR